MKVTFKGNPLTLIGKTVNVGDTAPDFTVVTTDLSEYKLADTKGIRLFTTVPSLDTPVCDQQVRRFNEEASKYPNVSIYAISADLPFAQARWCGAVGIKNVKTLSDYKYMSFADAYGVHIKELRLLARAVFIVDTNNKIVYKEIVDEITNLPNFDNALQVLAALK